MHTHTHLIPAAVSGHTHTLSLELASEAIRQRVTWPLNRDGRSDPAHPCEYLGPLPLTSLLCCLSARLQEGPYLWHCQTTMPGEER